MRLDKPIGSLLLLWPTYWALFLSADGWPDLDLLIIFTLGVVVMRSAGCVINDYADRDIDKHVKRTQNRPITSGEISSRSALTLFILLLLLALILVLQTNLLTIQLSLIAASLAAIYPFTKRWTSLPAISFGGSIWNERSYGIRRTNRNHSNRGWAYFHWILSLDSDLRYSLCNG
jgi:4-hydroxybenzoate polyprenyltransferase